MVIRKMNTVFARHGRLIFGVITVIIVVSFMGILRPGGLGEMFSNWGSKNAYGEIFGETVSRNDIIEKADRDLIIGDLMFNAGLNNSQAAYKVQANAFSKLCLLAAAKRRGITASNKEITDFIIGRAKFRNSKTQKFDNKLYGKYIDGELKSNGFSADELDLAVREHLINTKLLSELQDSVVVTDDEVKDLYRQWNENYYTSYAVFDKEQYLKKIKVSNAEAKNFFNAYSLNEKEYMPGKTKALLVEFKYNTADIQKLVAKELSPKAIKDFYDKNKKLFMNKKKAVPFAKAKAKAKKILASRYAKKFASQKALKFAEAAYDAVGDAVEEKQRKAFDEVLNQFKYKAVQSNWFKDDANKIGSINERILVKELSALREVPISNHVICQNAAYVAFITERIMPQLAKFEEVKAKVTSKLKDQKALNMARSQARELVAKLQKMDKAKRLQAVRTSKTPKFKSAKAFSRMKPPSMMYGNAISKVAVILRNGEISPAQNTFNGAVVVLLRKRVLPAMKGFTEKQKMLSNIYKRQKTSVAQASFSTWLQTKCNQFQR